MSEKIAIEVILPLETIETIVAQVTERVLAELQEERLAGRWLTGAKEAATYLGCSPRRIYNRLPGIPHARDGARLIFNTADLDDWLRGSQ